MKTKTLYLSILPLLSLLLFGARKSNTVYQADEFHHLLLEEVSCHPDYDALVDLYYSTNGPNWNLNPGWLANCDVCIWPGITCAGGRVTEVRLVSKNLNGPLPASIGNLSSLTYLDLANNSINGSIPNSIGNLTNLEYLRFDNNSLSGSLPPSITNLIQLKHLKMEQNTITGQIPQDIGNLIHLESLDFNNCDLSGSLPESIGNLIYLKSLLLSYNQLSGPLPTSIGQLSDIQSLMLSGNQFSGILPRTLGNLEQLINLHVNQNRFTGCFPPQLNNLCGQLISYNFSGNLINNNNNFNAFCSTNVGVCPCQDGYPVTWYLDADGDGHASISTQACDTPGIGYVNTTIPVNDCNDSISWIHPGVLDSTCNGIDENCDGSYDESYTNPECQICINGILNDSTNTWFLDADGDGHAILSLTTCLWPGEGYTADSLPLDDCDDVNALVYPGAPDSLCNGIDNNCNSTVDEGYVGVNCSLCTNGEESANLDYFTLVEFFSATNGDAWTNNSGWLSGCNICEWYGVTCNTTGEVSQLNLAYNNLTGILPASLTKLSKLGKLNLIGNLLTGSIPSDLGNIRNLREVFLDNNSLTGSIPASLGNLTSLRFLYLNDNQLTGSIPAELGNLSGLSSMILHNNQLTGTIPSTLGSSLSNLDYLNLSHNQLSGSIPASIGEIPNILSIKLNHNQLSGSIPGNIGDSPNLNYLFLNNNELSGCLPSQLSVLCEKLVEGDFSGNPELPGGGNLAAFCMDSTGSCCSAGTELNWFLDADGDGHASALVQACSAPGMYYTSDSIPVDDCNDMNPAIFPGAPDSTCNGIDEDCDGSADDGFIVVSCQTCTGGTIHYSGPPAPIASVTKQLTCTIPTGTITVSNPTTGHTYSFDNGLSFQTSRIKSGLDSGLYFVKIKSNLTGCISESIQLIINGFPPDPPAPEVIVSAQPTCAIPTGTLKVTDTLPGFKYSFDQGLTFQTSKTKSGLTPGSHQVFAQSIATGCISAPTLVFIDSVPTSGPPAPIASVTKPPTCTTPTGTITVSNPTTGHTYSFDNGMSFQTSRVKADLQPGWVQIIVKSNATGCISDFTVVHVDTIPENPAPPQVIVSAQPTCTTPTGTLKVTDTLTGFKYSFDNGLSFQTSKTKSGLAPGSHQVLAQSIATGCISAPTLVFIDSIPTSGPPAPIASVTKPPTCNTPTGTITVSNPTTGHTYSFDNGLSFQTSRVKSGLDSGDYHVRVKSNLTGCISEATFIYIGGLPDNPPAPQVMVSAQPTCDIPTGTVKVTDTLPGFKYSFDQGLTFQSSKTKSGLAPGYHQVLAQSITTGCVSTPTPVFIDAVPTSGPPPPIGGVTVQPTCPSPTGTITIFFPTSGHTYSFDDGMSFQTSRIKNGVTSGTYLLRVKSNATGCLSGPISVTVNELPFVKAPDASVTVQATCDSPSGTIVVSKPTTGHTYSFDDGQSFQDSGTLSGLPPSIYYVRVKSNTTGCISEGRIVIIDSVFCDSLISGITFPSRIYSLSPTFQNGSLPKSHTGSFKLYPNPASGYFRIKMDQLPSQGKITVRMTDSYGRVLRQFERSITELGNESFQTQDLPRGIIYIQLISEEIRYPVGRLVLVD